MFHVWNLINEISILPGFLLWRAKPQNNIHDNCSVFMSSHLYAFNESIWTIDFQQTSSMKWWNAWKRITNKTNTDDRATVFGSVLVLVLVWFGIEKNVGCTVQRGRERASSLAKLTENDVDNWQRSCALQWNLSKQRRHSSVCWLSSSSNQTKEKRRKNTKKSGKY